MYEAGFRLEPAANIARGSSAESADRPYDSADCGHRIQFFANIEESAPQDLVNERQLPQYAHAQVQLAYRGARTNDAPPPDYH